MGKLPTANVNLRFIYSQPNLSVSLSQTWYLLNKNVFCLSAVGNSCEEDMVLALQNLETSLITPFLAGLCLASASLIPKSNSEPQKGRTTFLHPFTHLLTPTSTTTVSRENHSLSGKQECPRCIRNPDTFSLCSFLSACFCPWPFFNFLHFLADSPHPSL